MSRDKKTLSGSSFITFLLGLICGILFGRLLFGIAIAVLIVVAAIWIVCEVRKK